MCKKNLLDKISISNKQIYKISINKKNPKKISKDYEKTIKKYFLRKKNFL